MATNALPYLLNQAFTIQSDSAVRRLSNKIVSRLPQSWGLPPSTSQNQISGCALEFICSCRPSAGSILPPLLGYLGGTNVELHLRALRILGSTAGPINEAMPYLTRDIGDPNPSVSQDALALLLLDPANAQLALPEVTAYLKGTNEWLSRSLLSIVSRLGSGATDAVPVLKNLFQATTNWDLRCDLAETLKAVDVRQAQFAVPVLLQQFDSETNWDRHMRLTRAILRVDPSQTKPVSFLTNAWETVEDLRERNDVSWFLTELYHTNIPGAALPLAWLKYRSPPFERWLALGLGERQPQGPTVERWISMAQGQQPQFQGFTLQEWLLKGAPVLSASNSMSDVALARRICEEAVHSIGTNALPWLIRLASSTNIQDFRFVRRGFLILQTNAVPAIPALAELTGSQVPMIRSHGYDCLSALGLKWTDMWPTLIPTLHSDDLTIRSAAAQYLYQIFPGPARQAGLEPFVDPRFAQ